MKLLVGLYLRFKFFYLVIKHNITFFKYHFVIKNIEFQEVGLNIVVCISRIELEPCWTQNLQLERCLIVLTELDRFGTGLNLCYK